MTACGDGQTLGARQRIRLAQIGCGVRSIDVLAIGNFNETMHSCGLDRRLRGEVRGLEILGSRTGSSGARSPNQIPPSQL